MFSDFDKPVPSTTSLPLSFAEPTPTYTVKEQRKIIKDWAKNNIVGTVVKLPQNGWNVTFTASGIKEALNQPHKKTPQKNDAIREIIPLLIKSTFIMSSPHNAGDHNIVFHYFEISIDGEESYIVLKETKHNRVIAFYSIVDKIKK